MILPSHLELLRDNFIRSSWANPSLETNINVKPTLLNLNYAAHGTINIMRRNELLPSNTVGYDVYSLEYVRTAVFRNSKQIVGEWVKLTDFCKNNNLLMHLSYPGSTITGSFSETYIQYLSNRTVIVATPFAGHARRGNLNIQIRTSNDSLETKITVDETLLDTTLKLSTWLSGYNNDPDKAKKIYHIDGVYNTLINGSTVKLGSRVSTISDTSLVSINDVALTAVPIYVKDGVNHYLVNLDDTDSNRIYSRFDTTLYLIKGNVGRRIIMDDTNVFQITNDKIGLRATAVEEILSGLGWTEDQITLRAYVGNDVPARTFTGNDNYWYSLQKVSKSIRQSVLLGTLAAPECLYARTLHGNAYNLSLELEYEDITTENLSDSITVSTWDNLVNRSLIEADEVDSNFTNLVQLPGAGKVICAYDVDGVPRITPNAKMDSDVKMVVGYSKETDIINGMVIPISDFTLPVAYVKVKDDFTLLIPNVDYATIANEIRVNVSYKDVYGFDLASTLVATLDADLNIQPTPHSPALYGLGHISLLTEDRTLTPRIDYTVIEGKILIHYGGSYESLSMVFQPVVNPDSCIVETGYTRNGTISVDGSYLELDPTNHIVVVDGKVYFPKDIQWDTPYLRTSEVFKNGVPYAILRVLLCNCDGDVHEVKSRRDDYYLGLSEIAEFKDINEPPIEELVSYYPESYPMVSVFLNSVYKAALVGEIAYDRATIASLGISKLVEDYLYLLTDKLDITANGLIGESVEVRAHNELGYPTVNNDLYSFLERVNNTYLNSRVLLNTNFRISA